MKTWATILSAVVVVVCLFLYFGKNKQTVTGPNNPPPPASTAVTPDTREAQKDQQKFNVLWEGIAEPGILPEGDPIIVRPDRSTTYWMIQLIGAGKNVNHNEEYLVVEYVPDRTEKGQTVWKASGRKINGGEDAPPGWNAFKIVAKKRCLRARVITSTTPL